MEDHSQSVNPKVPKSQFDTLECTLEELAVLELIYKNPSIKQKELMAETGKSLSTIKRIMESLQKKEYIRRVDGKRYGKWEVGSTNIRTDIVNIGLHFILKNVRPYEFTTNDGKNKPK